MEDSNVRITLITGANKGLGFESARRLKAAGHKVYIGARDEQRGREAADAIGAELVVIDVTDEASTAAAAAEVERREGRLDVLINNAGIPGPRFEVDEYTGADIEAVLATNVTGTVRVTHAFLPLLRRSGAPVIVNVSSGMGSFDRQQDPATVEAKAHMPLYSASKAALTMLTTEYAKLLPEMRVNAADPGYTATDFTHHTGPQDVTEGTDAIVSLATVAPDGPTGTFVDRDGPVAW